MTGSEHFESTACDSAHRSVRQLSSQSQSQPQPWLHYNGTLPIYSTGILLPGTNCSLAPIWEMNKSQITITRPCTPVDTLYKSNWRKKKQAPVKRHTSMKDCMKIQLSRPLIHPQTITLDWGATGNYHSTYSFEDNVTFCDTTDKKIAENIKHQLSYCAIFCQQEWI